LEGMHLETLAATHAHNLRDIQPLSGMPLRELYLANSGVRDLTPLATWRELERLSTPKGCTGMEALRGLPKLRWLSYDDGIGDKTAEQFWKEYDAQQKGVAPK